MSTRPASMDPTVFTPQTVYCGNCVDILKHFPSESVDLVYIDSPFNSSRSYEVFWGEDKEH
ncbi:site-specific DNA-methyltransferase [bacterium]|nr:site-specific DNA-methyltransferase [bacterium]